MIAVGTKLTSLRMVKAAITQGFALKTIQEVDACGEQLNELTGEYEEYYGTEPEVGYEGTDCSESTINYYLRRGEIFACPMEEYNDWYATMYYHDWDDTDDE